ncbi:MAG: hypothetical protein GY839_04265, partial [candidate division Zixibacteria bacterium]|nr:hypothetical protein [candidate division Zixibacteria bacterium]
MKRTNMKQIVSMLIGLSMVVSCLVSFSANSALAKDLPPMITITSYKVGSLGYTVTSGFREAIEAKTSMKVRVEPYGT